MISALTSFLATVVMGGATPSDAATPDRALADVVASLRTRYDDVRHMSADEVAALAPADILLIDTRSEDEFGVSHLRGAQWAAPGTRAAQLVAALGDDVNGRIIVFYCSVGERSSRLARRAQTALREAGAADVVNLDGGIFGWHNTGREVVRDGEATRDIHPYNKRWGGLLTDPSAWRFSIPD